MKEELKENLEKKRIFLDYLKKECISITNEYAVDLGKEIYSLQNDFYTQIIRKNN